MLTVVASLETVIADTLFVARDASQKNGAARSADCIILRENNEKDQAYYQDDHQNHHLIFISVFYNPLLFKLFLLMTLYQYLIFG